MALAWHCCRCLLLAGLLVIVASSLGHTPTRTESVFYYQPANILGICNQLTVLFIAFLSFFFFLSFFILQAEIVKRLNAICAQVIPFLSQEVRQVVSSIGLEGTDLVFLQIKLTLWPCLSLGVCIAYF